MPGVRLRVGDLELDLLSRRARVGERVVKLTPREFELLATLMRHQDRTVGRRELLASVWAIDFDPRSNRVDVYVRYLRNKLGDGWIETVRGVGYRIAPA
ncbi:MAG TPA: winged helix-turn-helix domain-containing protein [Actinomycetota bacterium]|nr:winged helix-turn-helix domain-containing protein [Actinomycetota bacterium]